MIYSSWQIGILLATIALSIGLVVYSLYILRRLYKLHGSIAYIRWLSILSVLLIVIYVYYLFSFSGNSAFAFFIFAFLISSSIIWIIIKLAYSIGVDLKNSAAVEHYYVTHDVLTGLPNLAFFNEQLDSIISDASKNSYEVALLIVDLNRFQLINETIGYFGGDVMLQEIARRIQRTLRKTDLIARLGGDEFAVLINPVRARGHLRTISNNIKDSVKEPLAVDHQPTDVGVSIGVSLYPKHSNNGLELIESARVAMLSAKHLGTTVQFYDPNSGNTAREDIHIIGMLQRAVQHKQLSILYQPQISLNSMKLVSVEALIRWNHPRYGKLDPSHFIPFAEKAGLIYEINLWLLEELIAVSIEWKEKNIFLPIAINLTVKGFLNKDFQKKLDLHLKLHPWVSKFLKIELTETSILEDEYEVIKSIRKYQSHGMYFSLDDYGTRHSSLEYLKKLPFNELKVDRSFMINSVNDKDCEAIVLHAVEIASILGLSITAEGIENKEILDFAKQYKFDLVQGYYFSQATSAEKIASYILKNGMDAKAYLNVS